MPSKYNLNILSITGLVVSSTIVFLLPSFLYPSGAGPGKWLDLIAPLSPNLVLSDTISISNCDNTVSILTKNLPLAVEVLTSSLSQTK